MSLKIFAFFLVLTLISQVMAFEVTPQNPVPGEVVAIRGSAAPGEVVKLRSSFEMELPVENGKYEYVAKGVDIPQKPNRLSVVAKNVDELNVGVKMGIWVTMPVSTSEGVASLSKSDVPPGRYTLKMFGDAVPGSDGVSIRIDADTAVRASSDGNYELVMETSGVPEGEYKIWVAGEEQVIVIGEIPVELASSRLDDLSGGRKTTGDTKSAGPVGSDTGREDDDPLNLAIPDPYYREIKKADAENPNDVIRYVSTARNRAIDLSVFEKAAFYEHYLKGCGFNVSFAYSETFDNGSKDHIWLLVTTQKGEVIEVDPSYREVGSSSILPLGPKYSRYDERFMDIYEASGRLGIGRLAWWTDEIAWGSSLAEVRPNSEEAVNISVEPVEDKGFIPEVRNLLTQLFSKVGL